MPVGERMTAGTPVSAPSEECQSAATTPSGAGVATITFAECCANERKRPGASALNVTTSYGDEGPPDLNRAVVTPISGSSRLSTLKNPMSLPPAATKRLSAATSPSSIAKLRGRMATWRPVSAPRETASSVSTT